MSLLLLISEPNPDDGLMADIVRNTLCGLHYMFANVVVVFLTKSEMYATNKPLFIQKAREYTQRFAMQNNAITLEQSTPASVETLPATSSTLPAANSTVESVSQQQATSSTTTTSVSTPETKEKEQPPKRKRSPSPTPPITAEPITVNAEQQQPLQPTQIEKKKPKLLLVKRK